MASSSPATPAARASGRIWRTLRGPWPVHPILLGAYFVLFLLSQNLGEVTLAEAAPLVAAAAAGSAVIVLVAALVFGNARRGGIVASALVAGFFGYGHVVEAVRPLRLPGLIHPVGWVLVVVAAIVLAIRLRDRLPSVTRALDVLATVLVAVSLIAIVPYEAGRPAVPGVSSAAIPSGAVGGTGRKPDIYHIIFDRHANDATLQAAFGFESPFTTHLREAGFVVLDHAYANYLRTHLSLASSLNMTYLEKLTEAYGRESNDVQPVFEMIQDNAVGRYLQAAGYRYIHTGSAYGPTDRNRIADENPRRTNETDFSRALFDTTVLPGIERRISTGRTPSRNRLYETARWQWGELAEIRAEAGPKYVFSHFLLPHPPYIFDTDGSYVDEATEKSRTEAENYRRQLAYTDGQIEAFIAPLLALPPDQRPIILLQADEGPFPRRYALGGGTWDWTQATADEVEMKFGILNAMYLPGEGPVPSPAMTPVNTWRFIFSRYLGAGLPLLPDRVYTSRTAYRAFDFIDITERLKHGAELLAGPAAGASP